MNIKFLLAITIVLSGFLTQANNNLNLLLNSKVKLENEVNVVSLNWRKSIDGIEHEVRYRIAGEENWNTQNTGNSNEVSLSNLNDGVKYEWQVGKRSTTSDEWEYSSVKSFVTYKFLESRVDNKESFFINPKNNLKASSYYELQSDLIRFSFNEKYVSNGLLKCKIYDWSKSLVKAIALPKQFGANYYEVNINSSGIAFKKDAYYVVEVSNTNNKKQYFRIKYLGPPVALESDILNPKVIYSSCENNMPNNIIYYADILGGSSKYKLTWYVSENPDEEGAFFTKNETIEKVDNILMDNGRLAASQLHVEAPFPYYVILKITDNCGQETRKVAKVSCDQNDSDNWDINNGTSGSSNGSN